MLDALYAHAALLAGRPVEVIGTKDHQYVVEWFCYGQPPPPKAPSEVAALERFIGYVITV